MLGRVLIEKEFNADRKVPNLESGENINVVVSSRPLSFALHTPANSGPYMRFQCEMSDLYSFAPPLLILYKFPKFTGQHFSSVKLSSPFHLNTLWGNIIKKNI